MEVSFRRPGRFHHFLDGRGPCEDLTQTVLEHRAHPLLSGQPKIFGRAGAVDDRIVEALIQGHEFEDGLPPTVAALLALAAARALPKTQRLVRGRFQLEFGEEGRRILDWALAV